MQFAKKKLFICLVGILSLVSLSHSGKIMNKNSVFAPENFKKPTVDNRSSGKQDATADTSSTIQADPSNAQIPSSTPPSTTTNTTTTIPSPAQTETPVYPNPSTVPTNSTTTTPPATNSTTPTVQPEVYNSNFECPEGQKWDANSGKCIGAQTFDVMFSNITTSTMVKFQPGDLITPVIVPQLANKTQHYDEKRLRSPQIKEKLDLKKN